MDENKKEKKLPDKDYYRTSEDKTLKKRNTAKPTEEEKREFAEAFEEDGDVKTYSPDKKEPQKKTASDKTMLFTKLDDEKAPEVADTSGDSISHTKYFNLRQKGKKAPSNKGRKNLMQSFRVLSKDKDDRAILEAAPTGEGSIGFADSVKAQQGEDIFEAVEKAYISKAEEKNQSKEKKSRRELRNEKGAQTGRKMLEELKKETDSRKKEMIVCAVLFGLSLILTLLFSDEYFYVWISLALSVAACILNIPVFRRSLTALKSFSAVSDTAVAVMSIFVLIHNICTIILGQTTSIYTVCIIFACFLRLASEWLRLKNKERLVSAALKSRSLSTLQRIAVKNDAITFTKNTVKNNEPDIFYCTRAMLDTSLEEPEYDNTKETRYIVFTTSFVLLACLAVGLLYFTTQMTGLSFVTSLTAAACALLPVMYDPLSRLIFWRRGDTLLKQGVCISGREALTHIGKSDGFVLEASDVFSGEVSRFRKSALSKMDQNDSAVFAALLIREAGSVLAPCFDSFLEQMNIVIPPVENFLYEERLGYSAWVLDRKVLVGNRQMLLNHSVSVPTKEQEKAYGKGRYVMYVVIDGEITATFLVGYRVLSSLRRYSRDFNKTGLVLMLNSKEAFLDEEAVASRLSIDASSVKILSSKAISIMEKYNNRYDRQVSTGLLCSGKKRSLMHLIMGCYNANADDRFILIMMLLGQLLGFLTLILSAILNMKLVFNPVAIVALRVIWSLITAMIIEKRNKHF